MNQTMQYKKIYIKQQAGTFFYRLQIDNNNIQSVIGCLVGGRAVCDYCDINNILFIFPLSFNWELPPLVGGWGSIYKYNVFV